MPFSILPFALLAIPALEIAVFILVGGKIGVLWTIALILVTAVIGSILLRIQGFQVVGDLQRASREGRVPGRELGHGAMILAAGILLLTPGFVTDTAGFLLFIPAFRDVVWRFLASRVTVSVGGTEFASREFGKAPHSRQDNVVDLDPYEFRENDEGGAAGKAGEADDSPWRDNRRERDHRGDDQA